MSRKQHPARDGVVTTNYLKNSARIGTYWSKTEELWARWSGHLSARKILQLSWKSG